MDIHKQIEIADDMDLLIAVIRGEAESEPFMGKLAVGCVVRNRVQHKRWPITYREVILQKGQFCCFFPRFLRANIFRHYPSQLWWRECKFAAWGILKNCVGDVTDGANLYWNPDVIEKPNWDWSKIEMLNKIGNHQFCREI